MKGVSHVATAQKYAVRVQKSFLIRPTGWQIFCLLIRKLELLWLQVFLRNSSAMEREELDRIRKQVEEEVALALQAAAQAPWPDKSGAYTDVQDTGSGRWLG